jgi:hypothetical protein
MASTNVSVSTADVTTTPTVPSGSVR